MSEKILVPVDIAHLDEAKSIIKVAMNHFSQDSSVVMLNVIEDIPKWAEAQLPKGTVKHSVLNAQNELKELAKNCTRKVEIDVRRGHAYQTILDVAEEKNIDLIVIASHRPGLRDYYLGSTAAKVVRHAPCSVYVVR